MKKLKSFPLIAIFTMLCLPKADAQMITHDPTSLAESVRQFFAETAQATSDAETYIAQLEQMYNQANELKALREVYNVINTGITEGMDYLKIAESSVRIGKKVQEYTEMIASEEWNVKEKIDATFHLQKLILVVREEVKNAKKFTENGTKLDYYQRKKLIKEALEHIENEERVTYAGIQKILINIEMKKKEKQIERAWVHSLSGGLGFIPSSIRPTPTMKYEETSYMTGK